MHWMAAWLVLVLWLGRAVAQSSDCSPYAPPAVIRGRKIFDTLSGTYLPIKGINYYPRPNAGELVQTNSIDFYSEDYRAIWERDIAFFRQLNINVVRIYAVNPGAGHEGFFCALQAAGIYAIVSLVADCQGCAIGTEAAPACYSAELKTRGQFIIAEFSRYQNVLVFSAGNEVSLSAASTETNGPCQKQFIRDMRAYVQSCNATIRPIPIGLEVADTDRTNQALWYA
jgi:1,3-beta-glucanosyltransferase GAS5